jgi:Uma2 family endonuclease
MPNTTPQREVPGRGVGKIQRQWIVFARNQDVAHQSFATARFRNHEDVIARIRDQLESAAGSIAQAYPRAGYCPLQGRRPASAPRGSAGISRYDRRMRRTLPVPIDPDDPRAPASEVWAQLTEQERALVVEALPSELPSASPPEGDRHRIAKDGPLGALGAYFRKIGRKVYLSSNLPVYYPAERLFAPDLIAVVDVEPHERDRWVVDAEGKGLDLALEVLYRGDDRKDLEQNVERFARLGIAEYFIYDRKRGRLVGHALPEPGARTYQPIIPQEGRWPSRVLCLDLALEGERLRLYAGTAALPELDEMAARGEALLTQAMKQVEMVERAAEEEARRAEEEAQRADRAEQELAALRAELERLRR